MAVVLLRVISAHTFVYAMLYLLVQATYFNVAGVYSTVLPFLSKLQLRCARCYHESSLIHVVSIVYSATNAVTWLVCLQLVRACIIMWYNHFCI